MRHISEIIDTLRQRALDKGHICVPLSNFLSKINRAKSDRKPFNQITEFPELLLNLKHHRIPQDEFSRRPYLLLHDRADWYGVDPIIKEFTHRLMWRMRKKGFPTYAHTALRTNELQEMLFLEGHSKIRKNGPHNRGAAVDIVHSDFHWEAHDDFFRYMGNTGKDIALQYNLPVEWGGDFKSIYDPAHWQLTEWKSKPPVYNSGLPQRRSPYSDTMRYA